MFLPQAWDAGSFAVDCITKKGLTPQFEWAIDNFGGRNIKSDF